MPSTTWQMRKNHDKMDLNHEEGKMNKSLRLIRLPSGRAADSLSIAMSLTGIATKYMQPREAYARHLAYDIYFI